MSWTKAIWIENNKETVGVVLSKWISDGFLYWPVNINANRAEKENLWPAENWKKLKIIKKVSSHDNRYICDAAETSSNESSDNTTSSSTSCYPVKEIPNFPECSRGTLARERSRSRSPVHCRSLSPSGLNDDVEQPVASSSPKERSDVMEMGKFQRIVLHKLAELKQELKELKKRAEPPNVRVEIDQMSTMDDFNIFEEKYKEKEEQNKMIDQLEKIGGRSLKENVDRVLLRLMSYCLLAKFNMRGKGSLGKRAFVGTNAHTVVIAAVMRSQTTTESEVTKVICDTLKYAPDKVGGGGRKSDQPR